VRLGQQARRVGAPFRWPAGRLVAFVGAAFTILLLGQYRAVAVPMSGSDGPVPIQPPPEGEAIAGSFQRGLWFDGSDVRRLPSGVVIARLATTATQWPYLTRFSGEGNVLIAGGRLFSGGSNAAPKAVPRGQSGCWIAGAPADGAFVVVAGDELISGPVWSCGSRPSRERQPIFWRKLTGGRWHVLTTVPGLWPPILAADGNVVAIGVQKAPSRMNVELISTAGRLVASPVSLPDGYLGLARPQRLVLSTPTQFRFPLEPRYDAGFGYVDYPGADTTSAAANNTYPITHSAYSIAEYLAHGQLVRRLGTSDTQPLISDAVMIVSALSASGDETLMLRSLVNGKSRSLIAFSDPGRVLMNDAFTWPTLTLVETTSAALPDGQFSCTYGTYAPPTSPKLANLNVTRGSFIPAPATPPQPTPAQRLAQCGPVPP
jgi:hypothetical protein